MTLAVSGHAGDIYVDGDQIHSFQLVGWWPQCLKPTPPPPPPLPPPPPPPTPPPPPPAWQLVPQRLRLRALWKASRLGAGRVFASRSPQLLPTDRQVSGPEPQSDVSRTPIFWHCFFLGGGCLERLRKSHKVSFDIKYNAKYHFPFSLRGSGSSSPSFPSVPSQDPSRLVLPSRIPTSNHY